MIADLAPLGAPEPLSGHHACDAFDSGEPTLDAWLKRKALANQASGASRTYVLCRGNEVVGYYALAAGSVDQAVVPGRVRRNMPDPVPVIVLARLAVSVGEQGKGLGRGLMRDAMLRARTAASEIGIAAVIVHALNERAKAFYLRCGFVDSPIEPLLLAARLKDIESALG